MQDTYAYTLVTAPAEFAVTAAEMEAHARAVGQPPEQYEPYIRAAQAYTELITSRKLVSQTWKWFRDDWPCGDRMELPFGQLTSVTHIKYYDTADAVTTFSSANYSVSTARDPGVVALKYQQSWPTATLRPLDPIEIQFVCGWATAGDVPADIRAAILLLAGHLYEHRESVIVGDSAAVESKALEMGYAALIVNWKL
jgi:uncharacterized phiE125 gp8 family phage protein